MKLAKDERVLHKLNPTPRLMVIWFFRKILPHGIALSLLTAYVIVPVLSLPSNKGDELVYTMEFTLTLALIALVLGSTLSYIYHRYLLATLQYLITDRRCIWTGGLLLKKEHSVSYHKITDVERSRNWLEQLLNLSSISLFTPGTASMWGYNKRPIPELHFEGLPVSEDQAECINEQVRKYGMAQP